MMPNTDYVIKLDLDWFSFTIISVSGSLNLLSAGKRFKALAKILWESFTRPFYSVKGAQFIKKLFSLMVIKHRISIYHDICPILVLSLISLFHESWGKMIISNMDRVIFSFLHHFIILPLYPLIGKLTTVMGSLSLNMTLTIWSKNLSLCLVWYNSDESCLILKEHISD